MGSKLRSILAFLIIGTAATGLQAAQLAKRKGELLFAQEAAKEAYKKCEDEHKDDDAKIRDCFEKEYLSKLPEEEQKRIAREAAILEDRDIRQKEDELPKAVKNTTVQNDSAVLKRIEDYLYKRLQEAIYGQDCEQKKDEKGGVECKGKQKRIADHKTFHRLYESQLGKNIIASVSAYCRQADSASAPPYLVPNDKDERAKVKATNLQNLAVQGTQDVTAVKGYEDWIQCIQVLDGICHQTGNYSKIEDKYSESRDLACQTQYNIEGFKNAILETQKVQKEIDKLENDDRQIATFREPFEDEREVYTGDGRKGSEKSINELTNLSSGELARDSGAAKAGKEAAEKLKEICKDESTRDACLKQIAGNLTKDDVRDIRREENARLVATKSRIAKFSEQEAKDFLKREGRSDVEIEKIFEKGNLQEIRKRISEKYEREKAAVIASKVSQLEGKVIDPEGKDDSQVQQEIEAQVSNLEVELTDNVEEYAQSTFYNNMISGYFNVGDTNVAAGANPNGRGPADGPRRNTAALKRELKNSNFDQDRNENAEANIAGVFQKIKENLEAQGVQGGREDDSENVAIQVEQVNNIFKIKDSYDIDPENPPAVEARPVDDGSGGEPPVVSKAKVPSTTPPETLPAGIQPFDDFEINGRPGTRSEYKAYLQGKLQNNQGLQLPPSIIQNYGLENGRSVGTSLVRGRDALQGTTNGGGTVVTPRARTRTPGSRSPSKPGTDSRLIKDQ